MNHACAPTRTCYVFDDLRTPGFRTAPAKSPDFQPFGLWFANGTTLYVGDEGTADATDVSTNARLTGTTQAARPRESMVSNPSRLSVPAWGSNMRRWMVDRS